MLECRLSFGKPFLRRPRKCFQLETRASRSSLSQWTCYSNQNVPFQNRDLKSNILPTISTFVNEGIVHDSCEPAFKFLVRNGCVKDREIKGLDVFIRLIFGD